jgi:hypothetical protein
MVEAGTCAINLCMAMQVLHERCVCRANACSDTRSIDGLAGRLFRSGSEPAGIGHVTGCTGPGASGKDDRVPAARMTCGRLCQWE